MTFKRQQSLTVKLAGKLQRLQLRVEKMVTLLIDPCRELRQQAVSLALQITGYLAVRDGLSVKQKELEALNADLERLVTRLSCDLEKTDVRLKTARAAADSAICCDGELLGEVGREIGARARDVISMLDGAMRETAPARQVLHLLEATTAATHIVGLAARIPDFSRLEAGETRDDAGSETESAGEITTADSPGEGVGRDDPAASREELLRIFGKREKSSGPRRPEAVAAGGEEQSRWRKGG